MTTPAPRSKPANRATASAPHEVDSTERAFLDAAERLFGEHGFEGTKVRAIAEAAQVNLGTLHYYWGSKEALFRAVCERRLRPVIDERQHLLDACVAAAPNGQPSVEALLTTSVAPVMRQLQSDDPQAHAFAALLSRSLTDPSPTVKAIVLELVGEGTQRYVRLLRNACPHLDDESFFWRLHGVFGMVQHLSAAPQQHTEFTKKKRFSLDFQRGLTEVVAFLNAGLTAAPFAAPQPTRAAPKRRTPATTGATTQR